MIITGTPTHFIMVDRKPVAEPDLMAWEHWMATADRHVGLFEGTDPRGFTCVSTVFLGLNLGRSAMGDDAVDVARSAGGMPGSSHGDCWFETTAHIGQGLPVGKRYATWEEAEAGHSRWIAKMLSE